MLTDRLGLPPRPCRGCSPHVTERWDGKGQPGHARGEEIPLPMRIVHVARDAAFQRMLGGAGRRRGGGPQAGRGRLRPGRRRPASPTHAAGILAPRRGLRVGGDARGRAGARPGRWRARRSTGRWPRWATSPTWPRRTWSATRPGSPTGRGRAAERCRARRTSTPSAVRRAALVHDLGRVAVPVRIWQKPGPLTPDDWERVRLHAYHSERVLARSPFLAALAPVASCPPRAARRLGLPPRRRRRRRSPPPARLLAAADAYHAMTEPRPHRQALSPEQAAETLGREASAGRLDPDAVAAVLEAAGQPARRIERPAGLTEREARGRRPARARPADQAGRRGARDLGQDRRPPHPERLRQDRRLDARGSRPVRDGARAHGVGRTPDRPHRRPLVAFLAAGARPAGGSRCQSVSQSRSRR